MLSAAFFSSHHGRFQPSKSTGSFKSAKSGGHLADDSNAAPAALLRRYEKYGGTFATSPPKSKQIQPPNPSLPPLGSTGEIRQNRRPSVKHETPPPAPQPQRLISASEQPRRRQSGNSNFEAASMENIYRNEDDFPPGQSLFRRSSASSGSTVSQKTELSQNVNLLGVVESGGIVNSSHYRSCPDLLKPCLNRADSVESGIGSTLSRHKFKSEKVLQKHKALMYWTLDDVLVWLQSIGLEDVTSLLIGYEITGEDVKKWNDAILESLGITDVSKREKILYELHRLKSTQMSQRQSPKKQSSQRHISFFSMIKRSQYDKILSLELPSATTVRDFTVATDPTEMALVVTGCKGVAELEKGDLIIELNGISCMRLAAVDFNKLLQELSGHKYQLVVLRKSSTELPDDGRDKVETLGGGLRPIKVTQSLNIFHL